MPVNIRDGELNKNDMTHDELTKYLHGHSQKKPHTPTNIPNKQKNKTTTRARSNCMVRFYKAINNIKLSLKKGEYVNSFVS